MYTITYLRLINDIAGKKVKNVAHGLPGQLPPAYQHGTHCLGVSVHQINLRPASCILESSAAILPWYRCPFFRFHCTPSIPPVFALSANTWPTLNMKHQHSHSFISSYYHHIFCMFAYLRLPSLSVGDPGKVSRRPFSMVDAAATICPSTDLTIWA